MFSAEHPPKLNQESALWGRTFLWLSAGAAGLACVLALLPATGHDQMWLLYVAARVLDGAHLYGPLLLESNPPLIVWILIPIQWTARILHLPPAFLFKCWVVVLDVLIGLWSARLLRYLRQPAGSASPLLFAFICIFAVMPARDFGQRDHLLALLLLPCILSAAVAWESFPSRSPVPNHVRIAAGIVAGIGICLKPHHLLVAAAIELGLLIHLSRQRATANASGEPQWRLRFLLPPELIAIIAICALYVAAIRIFTPDYLSTVVPLLRSTYWAIGPLTLPQLIAQAPQLHLVAAGAILLFVLRRRLPTDGLTLLLLLAGAASTLAYYLQGTGWYYQQLPALSFFALALWLQLLDVAEHRRTRIPSWSPRAAAAVSILAVGLAAHFSSYSVHHPFVFPSGLAASPAPDLFRGLPPGTPVTIVTTEVDSSVPPVYVHHLLLAQRQNIVWTLPAILRNESPASAAPPLRHIPPARLGELDRLQHQWMAEDLARWHPALILIERCQDPTVHCQILEDRHDNLLAWFLRDPAFRAQFAHYRFWRSGPRFDAYRRVE